MLVFSENAVCVFVKFCVVQCVLFGFQGKRICTKGPQGHPSRESTPLWDMNPLLESAEIPH